LLHPNHQNNIQTKASRRKAGCFLSNQVVNCNIPFNEEKERMKKVVSVMFLCLVAAACALRPTSTPPTQIVNQYPTLLPTPTLAVQTKVIEEDEKEEALNFFYELKIHMAAGEYHHLTDEIRYPITINVGGKPKSFVYAAELEANFDKIFSKEEIKTFISTDESELTFTANGVKVAGGIMWFDLICMDPACEQAEFLITEINN